MSKIKTKQDILSAMSKYGAYAAAVDYVRDQPDTATACEIWLGCDRADWLAWFGARHRPAAMRAFAYACADRAVRVYAADALAAAGSVAEAEKLRALAPIVDAGTARAGAASAACAYAHVASADEAYAAAAYATATAYSADERLIQLTELHALADAILIG